VNFFRELYCRSVFIRRFLIASAFLAVIGIMFKDFKRETFKKATKKMPYNKNENL